MRADLWQIGPRPGLSQTRYKLRTPETIKFNSGS